MICEKCKEPKLLEDFYYRSTGERQTIGCKKCVAKRNLLKREQQNASEYFNIDIESKFYQFQKTWDTN